MAISDKTRKILWGRSGNRCAFCRHELVIDATELDDEAVVGDECHIVSRQGEGPRHDPGLKIELLDEPDNLILLCRVHHKMVDDQHETYTVELLSNLKANHEKWVSSSLGGERKPPPVRIRRIKENIPPILVRLTSGRDVMAVVGGTYQYSFEHDEPASSSEAELVSRFLQEVQDHGELWDEIGAGERVTATYVLTELLRTLDESGFWVFGATEMRRVEGGVGEPAPWPISILRVVRKTSPEIASFPSETKNEDSPA